MPFRTRGAIFAVIAGSAFGAVLLLTIPSVKAQAFWERLPGSTLAASDGWVIDTNEPPSGFGAYRRNDRLSRWDSIPGRAAQRRHAVSSEV